MITPKLHLDHITIFAETLDQGCEYINDKLGIEMPAGGSHPKMGTHNCLLSLGPDLFLEVIAIDPDAVAPNHPRWFGLDSFSGKPKLATWVLGTEDINSQLKVSHPDSGRAIEMTRGDLKWLISVPDDGSIPLAGCFPTLIEWPKAPHPAGNMGDRACRLNGLIIHHPEAAEISAILGSSFQDSRVSIETGEIGIEALIQTPDGIKKLD